MNQQEKPTEPPFPFLLIAKPATRFVVEGHIQCPACEEVVHVEGPAADTKALARQEFIEHRLQCSICSSILSVKHHVHPTGGDDLYEIVERPAPEAK